MVVFAHSVIGASHVKNVQPCQDASLCVSNQDYTLIAVADSHGGERYFRSDVGSRFAVEAVRDYMTDTAVVDVFRKVKREKERERIILQLKKSIISLWNALVTEHAEDNPFTEDGGVKYEAYGTTLITVLQTNEYFLALQIGDGTCVTVDDEGVFPMPVPECEGLYSLHFVTVTRVRNPQKLNCSIISHGCPKKEAVMIFQSVRLLTRKFWQILT
ncbi:MAG: protein phosphatase 2C domain-containing protein [Oscillospiraceae bacterium]|nr:protein phosphatase 2C domain-containing protein [Oscillospiraceae bacterium]